MLFRKNVLLAPYTSFRIGGPAEFFGEAKSTQELCDALLFAKKEPMPITMIGGGQNVLIADRGISGLVVVNRAKEILVKGTRIVADSGVTAGELVARATQEGLSGFSWAAGLPGTVGGCVFGNAGTFGVSFGDIVERVTLVTPEGNTEELLHNDCAFGYKTSIFKSIRKGSVIVSATLKLAKGDLQKIRKEVAQNIRWRTLHHPPYQSAGCMFKNPALEHYHRLDFDVVSHRHAHGSFVEGCLECGDAPRAWFRDRIPAGWLIDRSGLKGKRVGDALVSDKHANFIMNLGKARAEDVVILAGIMKERVHREFGVMLEEEVQLLGFSS